MLEIAVVEDINLPDHAQVLNGQRGNFLLPQLVKADTARQDGDPDIAPDQIFDRCDIIHFQENIEVLEQHIVALQVRHKKISRTR